MVNAPQSSQSSSQTNASVSEQEAEKIRTRRGLRTLAHDIAEIKRNRPNQQASTPAGKIISQNPQAGKRVGTILTSTPPPSQPSHQTPVQTQMQSTHYREELEKLAAKYIPEKKQPVTLPQTSSSAPSKDALKSFEMNKAFNDQLHKNVAPQVSKPREHAQQTVAPVKPPVTPTPQPKPIEIKTVPIEKALETKEPEKKLTDLTAEDITRELEKVLHTHKLKDQGHSQSEEKEKQEKEADKEHAKKERPAASIKQLEETLYSITQRIQSSTSRIETYREEERAANTSLNNLFERRDIINKNLDPIMEKERSVLAAIKNHEEKEASSTNKIERRDAENRRWERENERRELEDERWKLEEIFEKLRLVIEKTEYELASIKKKLLEEEAHKAELEAEKVMNETHRSLLGKREELDKAKRKRTEVENEITNLKNELKVIRSGEESLEKDKRELESKIGALNDLSLKRSLEKDRRGIEDKLHEVEEKRWTREDELKKFYAEKDERDREINLLTTEVESLENSFGGLES
jgi:chromosome segregation ATPase